MAERTGATKDSNEVSGGASVSPSRLSGADQSVFTERRKPAAAVQRMLLNSAMICLLIGVPQMVAQAQETGVSGPDPLDVTEAGQASIVLHFPWEFQFPEVVRYRQLPNRMMLEPLLEQPRIEHVFAEGLQETFDRCLREAEDVDLRIVAAEHLARIARLDNRDLTASSDILLSTIRNTKDRRLLQGCLAAVRDGGLQEAAGALREISEKGDDELRALCDPLLAEWKDAQAANIWLQRVKDASASASTRALALRCLSQLNQSSVTDPAAAIIGDRLASFRLRMVAAQVLCTADPARALIAQGELDYGSGGVAEELLAISLLGQSDQRALERLAEMCRSNNDAVAVAAWQMLERHDPDRLLPLLGDGVVHQEAPIRTVCTRLVVEFPTIERIETIVPLLGDRHLPVRNACRSALTQIGREDAANKEQITDLITAGLRAREASWEFLEQACYVLGAFRRPEFATDCLRLCRHGRPEVYVAAAWLYHLMPEPEYDRELHETIAERYRLAIDQWGTTHPEYPDVDRQIGFLIQAAGYTQYQGIYEIAFGQLKKTSGLAEFGRSAGIWAVGALRQESGDEELSAALIGRLNDRMNPTTPEYDLVRRMSAQALGRIGADSAPRQLTSAFSQDSVQTMIPQTARWALMRMSRPSPGSIPPVIRGVGGWKLMPLPGD